MIPSALVCVSTALTLDKSGAGKLTDLAVPTATIAAGPGAGSAVPFATDKLAIPSFAELTEGPPFSRDTIPATPDHNPAALYVQRCAVCLLLLHLLLANNYLQATTRRVETIWLPKARLLFLFIRCQRTPAITCLVGCES